MQPKEYKLLKDQNPDLMLIDIRELYEYEYENLGGRHMPMGEILNHLEEIPKDEMVVLHCQSGNRAQKLVDVLSFMGFENVHNLEGGIEAYKQL
jgi:adenylyltransferase/sulfurtransferase